MKVLNLDDLAKTNRSLTLGGVTYEVEEMTVENFIETTKAAEKLEKEDGSIVNQVSATIDLIVRSIPTIKTETLRKLPLEQLSTIVKFIRGDLDEKETVPAAEGEVSGKV